MGVLRLSEDLTLKSFEEKYLLFNNKDGSVFELNGMSYNILSLCDGKNTEDDIIRKVMEGFDASRDEVQKDLGGLIEALLKKNFITVS